MSQSFIRLSEVQRRTGYSKALMNPLMIFIKIIKLR